MIKIQDFDYDLWTSSENGRKHYWARVRATGEVSEISHEVMRCLRVEEKRLYREIATIQENGSTLSLNVPHDDEKSSWEEDNNHGVIEMETKFEEKEFRHLLTSEQLDVYVHCILRGENETDYGKRHGITQQAVSSTIALIRKKAKKFFG